MKYLKEFIIGSSFPVLVMYFIIVYRLSQKIIQNDPEHYNEMSKRETPFPWNIIWPENYNFYSYFRYTITAPIFFGLLNIISLVIAKHFGLSTRMRFIIISMISSSFLTIYIIIHNFYNFKTTYQYIRYYLIILLAHSFTWNIVIYNLEKVV